MLEVNSELIQSTWMDGRFSFLDRLIEGQAELRDFVKSSQNNRLQLA